MVGAATSAASPLPVSATICFLIVSREAPLDEVVVV